MLHDGTAHDPSKRQSSRRMTSVSAAMYDTIIMVRLMDNESGRNSAFGNRSSGSVQIQPGYNSDQQQGKCNFAGIQYGLSLSFSHFQVLVYVFNGYCCLVYQDTNGKGQTTQYRDIDVFVQNIPAVIHRSGLDNGMVITTIRLLRRSRQEQQYH